MTVDDNSGAPATGLSPEPSSALALKLTPQRGETGKIDEQTRALIFEQIQNPRLLDRIRSQPTNAQHSMALRLSMVIALAILVALRRPDILEYSIIRMTIAASLLVFAGIAALRFAQRPLHLPEASNRRRLATLLLVVAAPLVLALLPDAHTHDFLHFHSSKAMWMLAGSCFLFGIATGAPLLVFTLAISPTGLRDRRKFLMAGLSAVILGNFTLQLHCPITDPLHLLLGHAGVLLPFALLGFMRRTKVIR